ncbi:MAG: VanW family protein [Patescibacteria group bacterium]
MKKVKIFKSPKAKKYAKICLLGFSGLVIVFLIAFGIYSLAFSKKVYAHQYIGEINFSGKTKEEIQRIIEDKSKEVGGAKIELKYQNDNSDEKIYVIDPSEIGLQYDVKATVDEVWGQGRSKGTFKSFLEQLKSVFAGTDHEAIYSLNLEGLTLKVKNIAIELDDPEKDYLLVYGDGKFKLSEDRKEGHRIDQAEIINDIESQIGDFKIAKTSFKTENFKPQVDKDKAMAALAKANKIIEQGDLILKYDNQEFKADDDTIGGFVKSKSNGDDLEIVLNDDRIKSFIDSIGKSIDVEAKNAKLTISDGMATVVETSITGRTLDRAQTKIDIENNIKLRMDSKEVNPDFAAITLKVALKEPEVSEQKISDLGIVELVGTATTNFVGSSSNRVHNIQIGAAAINGVLLKPDETFSTLKQLGTIDASSGYLEELVIKENKTIPEFGGGLCQVSSTLFRAALNAGMKITERQNHKYRVSYYEPPVGMDATIYDPAPDFKFVNNYGKYVLIQSKVVGTKITFDIYGTKDGRTSEVSEPVVTNVTQPDPPLYTETDTLAPGEKKKIDSAHPGATATFHYKVTRGSDILQEKDFVSKYVPWQEKWLVGKAAPAPAPAPAPTPEATPAPVVPVVPAT